MQNESTIYWNALSHLGCLTEPIFTFIKRDLGGPQKAWQSPQSAFTARHQRDPLFPPSFRQKLDLRSTLNPDALWSRMQKAGVSLITLNDKVYPPLLKELPDPPPILYTRGDASLLTTQQIAVVGSRAFTDYGRRAVEHLTPPLADLGLTITSGMALGIDSIAHRAALDAGGNTIAVLGSGLDDRSVYPQQHLSLAKTIAAKGLLLSEWPVGTRPYPNHFPQRNRIIAGLSKGVIVAEAADNSGALITGCMALDYNREVFAVPGSIFSAKSVGTNKLIRLGAKCTSDGEDITNELNLRPQNRKNTHRKATSSLELSKAEQSVFAHITADPQPVDQLLQKHPSEARSMHASLTQLELSGLIEIIGGRVSRIAKSA